MKFKMFQLAILLVFVVSIVFMAQSPNGFGHEAGENHTNMDHDPEFWVHDDTGDSLGNDKDNPKAVDPRLEDHRNYSDSDGDGTRNASSWGLRYYASPLLNGDGGEDEPNMVFGARVDAKASAVECSCSASAIPKLTDDMGLTTAFDGWAGQAKIKLEFLERKGVWFTLPIFPLPVKRDLNGTTYDTGYTDIRIEVSDTEITDKKSGEFTAGIHEGPVSFSATYATGTDVKRVGVVHSYSYGIKASLSGNPIADFAVNLSAKQSKTALSHGYLGKIEAVKINASYTGKK